MIFPLMDGEPESPPLSSVTVWYRCNVCYGYLHSIPALKKHASDDHGVASIKLPEGLPPEAIDGRVVCNPVPFVAPRPFRRLTLNPKIIEQERRRLEAETQNEREPPESVENQDDDNGPNIRVVDVAELQEPDEETLQELQEPPPEVQIENESLSCSNQNPAVGSAETEELQPPTPATAKLSQPERQAGTSDARRYQCPLCNKRFHVRVQLHFHTTRVHPSNYAKNVDSSSSNVPVESPQPGGSGNRKIKRGSCSDSTASVATAKIPRRSPAKRTRQPAIKSFTTSSEKKKNQKNVGSFTSEKSPSPVAAKRLLATNCATKRKMQNIITSESESSDKSASPQPRKKRLRSSTRARPSVREFSEKESVSSPEVRKPKPRITRSAVKKKAASSLSKFIVPDSSESAYDVDGNGSEDGSEEDPEPNENNESEEASEGELTDRSTTPESAVQEESNDEDKNRTSDSDDLFVPVVSKSKKKSKKKGKQVADRDRDTSTETICKVCEEQCENTAALVNHVGKYHTKPNSKVNLVCGFCQKSYTSKEMFNRHIVTHTNEQTNNEDELD